MKRHIIGFISATLLIGALHAQDFNNYKPVECKGNIPKDYITASADKYKKEIEKIETSDLKRKEEKDRKQFALETNFVLDDLLQSGLVLFNDDVTVYLNEVMAKLLEQPTDVKSSKSATKKDKVEVYALRSTSVNAFATDRGHIFVTLGLLAQLENEAQLAFILSHELVHAESGHSLELFLETKHLDKNSRDGDVLTESVFDENWVAKCNYSKELETEADTKGLDRLLKTQYSTATLNTVFDVLKYSYLPFDDVPFDTTSFQSGSYQFPDGYWIDKIKAITGEAEDSDDKASTHPNIANRRTALNKTLAAGVPEQGQSNYLVSEERFKQLRQITRFELPLLHLHRDEWPDALYTSYLLLKQYPESAFLQKCMVKSLYMQTKAKKSFYDNENVPGHADVEGESQQVYHFLEKIPGKEVGILALRYAWELHKKYPEDTELTGIVEDLFVELASDFKNLEDFNAKHADPSLKEAPTPAVDTTQNKERSKYDKIREQKGKEVAPAGTEYWRFAYVEYLGDEAFKTAFEKGLKEADRRKERDDYYQTAAGRKWLKKENAKREKQGYRLGIDKIVVVNPYFMQLDLRKDNAMQYIKTEVGQEHMRQLIEEVVPKADLKVTVLDVCNLKEKQSDQFNDIRFLNEWFSEQANHYDMTLTQGSNQARINAIAEKYGTDYFLWTGTVSLREKAKGGANVLWGVLLYPALPFFIYNAVKPRYAMLHYAILYDVKTGRRQVLKFEFFEKKNTDDLVKAHLYDTFSQIKRDEKSSNKKK